MNERHDTTGSERDDLVLEYRLTIAHRTAEECVCADYLKRRRAVLVPAVMEQAQRDGTDPVDVFAAFARRLHERNGCDDGDDRRLVGRVAALMALITPEASS